ncbi:MAG: hypothetical protein AAF899_14155 [Pseudomonadota bacterium]
MRRDDKSGSDDRADRLAAALRDNLRRRKAQARARSAAEPAGDKGPADGTPSATGPNSDEAGER